MRELPSPQPESVDLVIGTATECLSGDARKSWPAAVVLAAFCEKRTSEELRPTSDDKYDDFIECPVRERELTARIVRLLAHSREKRRDDNRVSHEANLSFLVGESETFTAAVRQMRALAGSDATVLLYGETGTGKELFARGIHYLSRRRGHPFLPVNCGSLPDQLFENELFGHIRGAYTGAVSDQVGLLARAEGGTLLLDEVDSLSLTAQVKLLRFLQDREYRALGAANVRSSNVRILAACNCPLRQLVAHKAFREDLFHRLNVLRLCIPALRERVDDIPRLAVHFLQRFAREENRTGMSFSNAALDSMSHYGWPGNVRELEAAVHRAAILSTSLTIEAAELDLPVEAIDEPPSKLREAKKRAVVEFERAYLVQLLTQHNGNVSKAAREAGKERRAFQRLLHKYGIERRGLDKAAPVSV